MKILYRLILITYLLTLLLLIINQPQWNILISFLLLGALPFIPSTLYRMDYLIYIYIAQVLGTSCGFYHIPYYDKCVHFLSGCVIVIIAHQLLKPYQLPQKLNYLFLNCIEMSIAFLWEIFEYSGLIFFNYDASRHYTTGVHDTMQDMMISLIGGLIISFIIYKYPSYIDNLYTQQPDNQNSISQQSHIEITSHDQDDIDQLYNE